ncbi:glycoside hydrolase family 6 protein [Kineococcus esterisolvens]|uniref:glycoside hydrolase family 6 protein n=1 Tax=unclassified Kineococcus TaxID=2621656 RepID=UPI003D7E8D2D
MPQPRRTAAFPLPVAVAATLAAAAVTGGLTAVAAPAAGAASPWTLSSGSVGRVDGAGAHVWSNGTATTSATSTASTGAGVTGRLVLRAAADLCGSAAPRVEVSVDGAVLGRLDVTGALTAGYRDYALDLGPGVPAGAHRVVVRYLNDHRGGGCDRNVHLQRATTTTAAAPTATSSPAPTPSATEPASTATVTSNPASVTTASPWTAPNPFATAAPYADPGYTSAAEADARRATDPAGAAALDRITRGGVSLWVGDWNSTATVAATVRAYAQRAQAAGRTGVVTTYAIPGRDCGNHSAGGLTASTYPEWSAQVAAGLRGTRTAVVVEPDAVAQAGLCTDEAERLALLRTAVQQLRDAGVTAVYLDAGNSAWTGSQVPLVARRLRAAGVEQARGFATNVSNFLTTAQERAYAEALSAELGGARYVVDTSRNGAGSNGEWCNPAGRELGAAPGAVADGSRQDANLWVKRVGESDGPCGGGPAAGVFWTEHAIALAR